MVPFEVEEALPGTQKDPSPTIMVAKMLSNLEYEEEVSEYESREDEKGSSNVPVKDVGEDGDQEEIQ